VARVSHKLANSLEGALAGGGDPATSPLYVFGPFLKLIVIAGVAQITFGVSVWLVVLTVAVVSAMYRLVMQWVIDGSGGSGLSEEEFGGWAVKVNAAITFIEYTLTFLVSMAALVTFIADRIPFLNQPILWTQYRTFFAIAISLLTGWLVNRGPKVATRTFGPATAGVLVLLWIMVFATIWQEGLRLPPFNLQAFGSGYFGYTLSGYAHILAVMTGIEVFANLVPAYEGTPAQKSHKAFNSLLIVMGTTAVTMLIVGPAIYKLSDPINPSVSVFTQTMDHLLPEPLPYLGTLVGVAVLISASAASAQGLQNLALGLRERHYLPRLISKRNQFDVADKPVWIEVGIVSLCFLLFGTLEETYLALYAAGVFILLSMTGWAVTKRLFQKVRQAFTLDQVTPILGASLAALLTSGATVAIFVERFSEGAWAYLLFIPALYAAFSYFRTQLGAPSFEMDYLGLLDASQLAGFGFGQYETSALDSEDNAESTLEVTWQPDPIEQSHWRDEKVTLRKIVVLLDGSPFAAQALPITKAICRATGAHPLLLSSVKNHTQAFQDQYETTQEERTTYLRGVVGRLNREGFEASYTVRPGFIADTTASVIRQEGIDLVITTTRGKSGVKHWLSGGVSRKLVRKISTPILLVQANEQGERATPTLERIVVALDGSIFSEHTLPYACALANAFNSELVLMSVPAVPNIKDYRAPDEFVENLRNKADTNMRKFLHAVARTLRKEGLRVRIVVTGSVPAKTILTVSQDVGADLIMLTSRGRGRWSQLFMGSVAEQVVQNTEIPVFLMPIPDQTS
jgi:nucleotide-binding universal stress UspA family protein